MPLKTPEQYEESLRQDEFKVYLMGERGQKCCRSPYYRPSMNRCQKTYELARDSAPCGTDDGARPL